MSRLAAALALAAALGCGRGDPFAGSYTRKEPRKSDVAGTYHPDADTLALLKKEGYAVAQHRLDLEADGRFAMIGMPDAWRSEHGRAGGRLDLDGGTWSLRRSQDWWGVEVQLKSRSTYFHLRGETPPYRIHVTLGDPDEGRALVFERR